MTRLVPITPRKLCLKLRKMGFELVRQKGSHMFWRHTDGRCTVVPFHKGEDIGRGLLSAILSDIEIDYHDFEKL